MCLTYFLQEITTLKTLKWHLFSLLMNMNIVYFSSLTIFMSQILHISGLFLYIRFSLNAEKMFQQWRWTQHYSVSPAHTIFYIVKVKRLRGKTHFSLEEDFKYRKPIQYLKIPALHRHQNMIRPSAIWQNLHCEKNKVKQNGIKKQDTSTV